LWKNERGVIGANPFVEKWQMGKKGGGKRGFGRIDSGHGMNKLGK
jgi:hypothetical protein